MLIRDEKGEPSPQQLLVQPYMTQRKRQNIINSLKEKYHLRYWATHTRGFYFSSDLTEKDLALISRINIIDDYGRMAVAQKYRCRCQQIV